METAGCRIYVDEIVVEDIAYHDAPPIIEAPHPHSGLAWPVADGDGYDGCPTYYDTNGYPVN